MPTPDASAFTRQKKITAMASLVRDGNQKVYTNSYQPTIKINSLVKFLSSLSKIPRSIPISIRILNITDIATDNGSGTYVLNGNTTIQSNEFLTVDQNLFVPLHLTLTINGTYNLTYTDDIVDQGTIIINGTFIVNVGTRYFNPGGTITNNGRITSSGYFAVDKRLENKNIILILLNGQVRAQNNDTIINDGTINIGTTGSDGGYAGLGTSINCILTNNGTINIGNGVSNNSITNGPGSTFTNNGTINVNNNSYLQGYLSYTSNPSIFVNNGTVNFNGTGTTYDWE
jgi:hypothetical protein